MAADDDLLDGLSRDLARAHERVSRIADAGTRARLHRRLIVVTNAAKHDLPAARRRLRELLRSLDTGDTADSGGSNEPAGSGAPTEDTDNDRDDGGRR